MARGRRPRGNIFLSDPIKTVNKVFIFLPRETFGRIIIMKYCRLCYGNKKTIKTSFIQFTKITLIYRDNHLVHILK